MKSSGDGQIRKQKYYFFCFNIRKRSVEIFCFNFGFE